MTTKIKEKKIINLNTPLAWSVESVSDLIKVGNIDVENRICYPRLIVLGDASRNTSVYDENDFKTAVNESIIIQEQIKTGSWFGELGHPLIADGQDRFMRVDMNNISHRFVNYKFVGNEMFAKVQFRKPKGDILWDWVTSGTNLAFSVRALTPTFVKKQNKQGQMYIYKYGRMVVVTFDSVLLPGFKEARIANVNSYDASLESMEAWVASNPQLKKLKMSMEEVDWKRMIGSSVNETKIESFRHNDLKELMKSQESLRIIEDLFQFSVEDSEIMIDDKRVYIQPQNYKEKLIIPTNTYIINRILGANRKIMR